MRKRCLVLLSLAAAAFALVMWTGPASAYFSHKDTEAGTELTAGYIEIGVEAAFIDLGVPGDVLKNGSLCLSNNSLVDVDYELHLTADADTANLLLPGKTAIQLYDDAAPLDTDISVLANGSLVLTCNGKLGASKSRTLTVELALKGAGLLDGNDFQNQPINLTCEVIAYETEGD